MFLKPASFLRRQNKIKLDHLFIKKTATKKKNSAFIQILLN